MLFRLTLKNIKRGILDAVNVFGPSAFQVFSHAVIMHNELLYALNFASSNLLSLEFSCVTNFATQTASGVDSVFGINSESEKKSIPTPTPRFFLG